MLVFLSLFSLGKASNEPDSLEVMHVRVTNQLANGVVLTIHCKSADNDLGVHVLSYGQFIGWHFRRNIWGTTRFYCYLFSKRGNNSFDVFRQGMCSRHCPWSGESRELDVEAWLQIYCAIAFVTTLYIIY
ncbi:hypothetical protein RHGRI_008800 [Rhododendron griersonianum]|uniref:S-protein homolog n=1 Tax=Rhododendron griersonianum TaxID=479676 RepID=A0AAV6L4R9_9ERIC|nr:hypothetical protein RHGRI_008800 [Rhododendron griersonianum]